MKTPTFALGLVVLSATTAGAENYAVWDGTKIVIVTGAQINAAPAGAYQIDQDMWPADLQPRPACLTGNCVRGGPGEAALVENVLHGGVFLDAWTRAGGAGGQ